ncbi:Fcf1-domain-containing protein [Schizophyllum amplum]|uniref:U three protein 23 n=1 Tax=Schizophyllum amplum TaxID=97359 RepID=A0A550CLX1_9AGAR|nr:Fcf1-domain-containing protein [Auriculariopsis ampla]
MRQKRAKSYRKLMSLYHINFGFRQPYQVLVDADMCTTAIDNKMELHKQLESVLQGDVKPMITQCCIHALYLQGKVAQPAVDLAKTFERRKCNHREPIDSDECLTAVVGPTNKHRYAIATQSQPLRVKLRAIPAVPIVHIKRAVMILEPPSDNTLREKERMVATSLKPSAQDATLKGQPSTSKEPPRKKPKGPKGPNPLSMKKKKTAETAPKEKRTEAKAGDKRKRNEGDEQDGEGEGGNAGGTGHAAVDIVTGEGEAGQAGGRKRKRKRKTGGAAGGVEGTVTEE